MPTVTPNTVVFWVTSILKGSLLEWELTRIPELLPTASEVSEARDPIKPAPFRALYTPEPVRSTISEALSASFLDTSFLALTESNFFRAQP